MRLSFLRSVLAPGTLALFALALLGLSVGAAPVRASVLVTGTEVGGNVVFSGGGTLDLSGADLIAQGSDAAQIQPFFGLIIVGPAAPTNVDVYGASMGPDNFGSGVPFILATSGSGDKFGLSATSGVFSVPQGYISGAPLTATMTFTGQTFATLGVTPGTYVYTLPSGDTFTIQIGGAPPDTTPPTITASADKTALWPPNGKMVTETITGQITDSGSGIDPDSVSYTVVDEYGEVQPSGSVPGGQITIDDDGNYSFAVLLRARRNGEDLDGRTYTIFVTAKDNEGNTTTYPVEVTVPHDQGS